jgi:protein-S-isoprenylcysteine O-methyltransferase Ste14
MTACGWVISALWLILVAYWALSAHAVKRMIGRWIWWREIAVRLGLFALVVPALQLSATGHAAPGARYVLSTSLWMGVIGTVLCVLGIGLAILGRASLGQSWPSATTLTASTTLVTSGPYARVRHPIYGGMLLAMLGSAISQSVLWVLPLVVYGPQFIRSARREEGLLLAQFPERYRAYMTRTKMLLPFLL